jgi:hypothetical protein
MPSDVMFADAFLAQEQGLPSIASGVKVDDGAPAEGFTWLVEKKRPQDVHRFTGTLTHVSDKTDLRSSTVYAFTHYAFLASNNKVVFADLQGINIIFSICTRN